MFPKKITLSLPYVGSIKVQWIIIIAIVIVIAIALVSRFFSSKMERFEVNQSKPLSEESDDDQGPDPDVRYEVIHMMGNEDRMKNIREQEKIAKIHMDIFDAIVGSALNIENLQNENRVKRPWDTSRYKDAKDDASKKKVMNGEIGCYMSHLELMKKIINSDYDGWTVIFEDDLALSPNFKKELKNILGYLNESDKPDEIDIVFIGSLGQENCDNGRFKENLCYATNFWGTQGYMVNKRSAEKIYEHIKYIDQEIDQKYRALVLEKKINGLIVVPTMVKQIGANSTIV